MVYGFAMVNKLGMIYVLGISHSAILSDRTSLPKVTITKDLMDEQDD